MQVIDGTVDEVGKSTWVSRDLSLNIGIIHYTVLGATLLAGKLPCKVVQVAEEMFGQCVRTSNVFWITLVLIWQC